MSAWGYKNFENDAASDYVWDVKESDAGVLKVIRTITEFTDTPPTEDKAEEVLAAIEYLAAAKGNPCEDLTPEATAFVSEHLLQFKQYLVPGFSDPDIDVVDLSLKAICKVREDSELSNIWKQDEDDIKPWHEVLDDLERRIKG
jgi:hypothetical protein